MTDLGRDLRASLAAAFRIVDAGGRPQENVDRTARRNSCCASKTAS